MTMLQCKRRDQIEAWKHEYKQYALRQMEC
jgi:hypothetical protein